MVGYAVWTVITNRGFPGPANPVTAAEVGVSIHGLMMDRDGVVQEQFAVVYAPKKKKRLSANCIELMDSEPAQHRHAAIVAGPSKSSEGQYLYYLVRWL
jgi:hypothetical protein